MLSHTESNRPSRGDPVVVGDDRRVGVFVLQRSVHRGIGRGDEPEDKKERRAVARGRGTGARTRNTRACAVRSFRAFVYSRVSVLSFSSFCFIRIRRLVRNGQKWLVSPTF